MQAYLDLMRDALDNGAVKSDRTGTGVRSLFGRQLRFDLAQGFPLVTTKKLHLKSIVRELVWFLQRRHQHRLSQGAWGFDLGRVGRRQRRPRSRLRQAMARLGWAGRADIRSDRLGHRRDPPQSRFAPPRRLGLERGRHRAHEARALPLPVPVLREPRQAVLPALPALGRHLSRRAVQHRKLRAAHPSDRPRMRARGGRVRPHVRRRASLLEPRGSGARAACPRRPARCRSSSSATSARSSTSTPMRSPSRATIRGRRSRPGSRCEGPPRSSSSRRSR